MRQQHEKRQYPRLNILTQKKKLTYQIVEKHRLYERDVLEQLRWRYDKYESYSYISSSLSLWATSPLLVSWGIVRTWIASPWELEELFLPLRWSWVLFCLLLKSFCRVFIENSVFVHALRGHFIREQHSAVFTWYIGAYFIGKYALQVLIVSAWRTRWSSCGVRECSEGNRIPGIYGV